MTARAGIDFETYSESGYTFTEGAWAPSVPKKPGIKLVGSMAYASHPSTEVISLAYNLQDGGGCRLWTPGDLPPVRLFKYMAEGGVLAAWTSFFEYVIWNRVCVPKLGWPPLRLESLQDTMAQAAAWSLPLNLNDAGKASGAGVTKDTRGKYLIRKLSVPQEPTTKIPLLRWNPLTHPGLFREFYEYNRTDVAAEGAVGGLCPKLSPYETDVWGMSERVNIRGVRVNVPAVEDCIRLLKASEEKYLRRLFTLTGGLVDSIDKTAKLRSWLLSQGVHTESVDKAAVSDLLGGTLPGVCREVLEIRKLLGRSSVKKLYAIEAMSSESGRVHGMFKYCGASRTGRFSGSAVQPQNLPKDGPTDPWKPEVFLKDVKTFSLEDIELKYTNPIHAISGSLRALFIPAEGHRFICTDYSAIEAVVLAELAEEPWRQEVFRTHGKIYETSASKITGIPIETIIKHKGETGEHHKSRALGKVAELASGYGGGNDAWVLFGADKFLSKDKITASVKAWRGASPKVCQFWYGLERQAINAVRDRGTWYAYNSISYRLDDRGVLVCLLPSGRCLHYHSAHITQTRKPWGAIGPQLRYMGWNTDTHKGPRGWVALGTWGGKLTENVAQAVARDIMVHAMLACERAGYPTVLHVHDEIVTEVPEGRGSVEELESLMCTLPRWATGWPIRATGGWEGKFFRKG